MTKLERKIITAIGNILRNDAEGCDPGEICFAGLIVDAWEREGFQSAMEKAQDGIDRISKRKASSGSHHGCRLVSHAEADQAAIRAIARLR